VAERAVETPQREWSLPTLRLCEEADHVAVIAS
jgi:hypothetical protein